MQPFSLLRSLQRDCIDYVRGKYPFLRNDRSDLDEQLRELLEQRGTLFQDPVIQIGRARKKISLPENLFQPSIQNTVSTLKELKHPYAHQIQAWRQILAGAPTVVSTGTGSGKSESFIIPALDGLLKQGFGSSKKEIGGLFIYPMNALVQDQFLRIFKYAVGSGLRVGIYNGAFRELKTEERKKICNQLEKIYNDLKAERPNLEVSYDFTNPETLVVDPEKPGTTPHILLTNYKMLEYMLLQSRDQPLIEKMDLKYLVLDEAHTYTGTLALEISCLLARLRVHLGPERSKYLPIATSATLSSAGNSEALDQELSKFFTKLFGKKFPSTGFIVNEQYEELARPDDSNLRDLLNKNLGSLNETLELPSPRSLFSISEKLLGISETDEEILAPKLYQELVGKEKALSSIILWNDDRRDWDAAVTWKDACDRFKSRAGGSADQLEALLILFSQSYVNKSFPLLGLRVHLFGRSEPNLQWSLDQLTIGDESKLQRLAVPGLSFLSCKKCGHMGYGAIGIRSEGVNEKLLLRPFPDFRDEIKSDFEIETCVFHPVLSISHDDEEALGKDWDFEYYEISVDGASIYAVPCRLDPNNSKKQYFRVNRTARIDKKKVRAPDDQSCPHCGTTAHEKSAVMVTHRGGASTDISVYTASTLSSIPNPKEQRLLIFSDNRQETSFLAGFLTDRHRKINLRRALMGYLEECREKYDLASLEFIKSWDRENRRPSTYDLAARLIISLEDGKAFDPRIELPATFKVSKVTLQNIIPRAVLDTTTKDWQRRVERDDEIESFKEWLLENYPIKDAEAAKENPGEESIDLMRNDERQKWLLRLVSELLLLDLSAGSLGEGSLGSLGLAVLDSKVLRPEGFKEFAKAHPELGLGERGIFACVKWLIDELLYAGQWSDLDKSGTVRSAVLPHYVSVLDLAFVSDPLERGILGRSLNNNEGLNKNSRLYRILEGIDATSIDSLRKIWSKKSTWDLLIKDSPLSKILIYSKNDNDRPALRPYAGWIINSEVSQFRGELSHSEFTVGPKDLDISGLPTGQRKNDFWLKVQIQPNEYYRRLLRTKLSEQGRLVRALEHNGMLSAADANDAVLKFDRQIVNTLVATPTLEMGVDLPDLPTVIHRAVPPDPSNYAQRSGRAGRGPKRAFILAFCGLGSHDMTFFEEPSAMVLGEILPPGIPETNSFIIRRHANGLVLELLGRISEELGPNLKLRFWHQFVDTVDLQNRLQELTQNSRNRPDFSGIQIECTWEEILELRRQDCKTFVDAFIAELSSGLWSFTDAKLQSRIDELKNEIRRQLSEFRENFRGQIAAYRSLVSAYLKELENYQTVPSPDDHPGFRRAKRFAELYLGVGFRGPTSREIPRPLSDLGATGFLPNFDFPGQVIRFKGLRESAGFTQKQRQQDDRMLQYDRGGSVALREFAPEQKVYGHGFVYQVDRYLENDLDENQAKGHGVCSVGCTTLSSPESSDCPECGAPVIKIEQQGNRNAAMPEIIQIREVHGKQDSAISDRSNFRERHFFIEEARKIGAPTPDEYFSVKENDGIDLAIHLTPAHYIKTVFLVLNTKAYGQGNTAQKVFYRKKGSGALFQVSLRAPENDPSWEPFIPCVQIEGQGIVFNLPFHEAAANGIVSDSSSENLEIYQRTLCTLFKRAAQRVLRLSPRSGNFDIQVHKIMMMKEDNYVEKASSFVVIDREAGGSGVIPLIWEHWDEVLSRMADLVKKDCCSSSCYRCLRSFDNQADHQKLNKKLFLVESEVPLTKIIAKASFQKTKVARGANAEVDKKSPAEDRLKDFIISQLPHWSLETQAERRTNSGGLLTISDFELKHSQNESRLTVYVDGFQYHGLIRKNFFKDILKRNELTGRGYRVLTIPAALVVGPQLQTEILNSLFNIATIQRPFPVVPGMELVDGMIPAHVEPRFKEQMIHNRIGREPLQVINPNGGIDILRQSGSPLGLAMAAAYEKMPKSARPFALQGEDLLLLKAKADDLLHDQETWKSFWIFYSGLSVLGYRPLVIWDGLAPT